MKLKLKFTLAHECTCLLTTTITHSKNIYASSFALLLCSHCLSSANGILPLYDNLEYTLVQSAKPSLLVQAQLIIAAQEVLYGFIIGVLCVCLFRKRTCLSGGDDHAKWYLPNLKLLYCIYDYIFLLVISQVCDAAKICTEFIFCLSRTVTFLFKRRYTLFTWLGCIIHEQNISMKKLFVLKLQKVCCGLL